MIAPFKDINCLKHHCARRRDRILPRNAFDRNTPVPLVLYNEILWVQSFFPSGVRNTFGLEPPFAAVNAHFTTECLLLRHLLARKMIAGQITEEIGRSATKPFS